MPGGALAAQALERERMSAASLLAGGLAYRLFFWLVPLGLVLAALSSFWLDADRASLEDAAREFGLTGRPHAPPWTRSSSRSTHGGTSSSPASSSSSGSASACSGR